MVAAVIVQLDNIMYMYILVVFRLLTWKPVKLLLVCD